MMEAEKILKKVLKQKDHLQNLSQQESYAIMTAVLKGELPGLKVSAFLTAMRIKGETPEELIGFIRAVREAMDGKYGEEGTDSLDLATNYDGKTKTVYILPSAIHLATKAGLRFTYHYAGRVPAKEGVTLGDIFESMDDRFAAKGLRVAHQREFCKDLYKFMPLRREMGFRTFINVIEKLLNPFGSDSIITSVFHKPYMEKLQETLMLLKFKRFTIVRGVEGGIEPHPTTPTPIANGEGKIEEIDPKDLDIEMPASVETRDVLGDSLEINEKIMEGKERGRFFNWALYTAGLLLYAGGKAGSVREGIDKIVATKL